MFKVTLETDNAAFEGDPSGTVARILRDLAWKLENNMGNVGTIHDDNGNRVGTWELSL